MSKDESNSVSVDINTIIKDFTVDAPGLNSPTMQTKLTKKNKQDLFLLSIGTFLEYFDLMLYVHLGFLLNELFFPKTDPYISQLLSAVAFCSTFIFRPFGAMIFGWIGDNMGRRNTIIITTFLMAISCIGIAVCPTYDYWGIWASVGMILCRILQGLSSMGEVVGAEIYMTEHTKPPVQYFGVAFIGIFSALGATAALAVGEIVTSDFFKNNIGLSWRIIFIFGAVIALVGTNARRALRESPEFIQAQAIKAQGINIETRNKLTQFEKKTILAYFCIQCARPLGFFWVYTYYANILKGSFGYTDNAVIEHNLIISLIDLAGGIVVVFLSDKIYPLKFMKIRLYLFFIMVIPPMLVSSGSLEILILVQVLSTLLLFDQVPGTPIFYKHFPLLRRFTSVSIIYALSRAIMYCITSFGTIILTNHFGNAGILILVIPFGIGMHFSLNYFRDLEIKAGQYPHLR